MRMAVSHVCFQDVSGNGQVVSEKEHYAVGAGKRSNTHGRTFCGYICVRESLFLAPYACARKLVTLPFKASGKGIESAKKNGCLARREDKNRELRTITHRENVRTVGLHRILSNTGLSSFQKSVVGNTLTSLKYSTKNQVCVSGG